MRTTLKEVNDARQLRSVDDCRSAGNSSANHLDHASLESDSDKYTVAQCVKGLGFLPLPGMVLVKRIDVEQTSHNLIYPPRDVWHHRPFRVSVTILRTDSQRDKDTRTSPFCLVCGWGRDVSRRLREYTVAVLGNIAGGYDVTIGGSVYSVVPESTLVAIVEDA